MACTFMNLNLKWKCDTSMTSPLTDDDITDTLTSTPTLPANCFEGFQRVEDFSYDQEVNVCITPRLKCFLWSCTSQDCKEFTK